MTVSFTKEQSVFVFDDFYSEPELILDEVKSASFSSRSSYFPGTEASSVAYLEEFVLFKLRHLWRQDCSFADTEQGFLRSLTAAQWRANVHVDCFRFFGMVCLNEPYEGGWMSFQKHKATGISSMYDVLPCSLEKGLDVKNVIDTLNRDGRNVELWEECSKIPYVFNRMIVFDSNFFHLAGLGKGDDLLSSKLTQHFVFRTNDPVRDLANR